MEQNILTQFKDLGAIMVLGLAALGSAAGAGMAGMSAIGAWKKNFSQNKPASFLLVALTAAPLTQTIYDSLYEPYACLNAGWSISLGVDCFPARLSAFLLLVVKCGRVAMPWVKPEDGNYLVVLGMAETVAL